MADDRKTYDFCKLCRQNHQQGLKHVYSKKHQGTVNHILKGFGKKISEAKAIIKSPVIEGVGFESGIKYWCYFCACEVEKHTKKDEVVVNLANFIQHLASIEHMSNVELFWKTHKIRRDDKQGFSITAEVLDSFTRSSEEALQSYLARTRHALAMEAHRIKQVESVRERILISQAPKFQFKRDMSSPGDGSSSNNGGAFTRLTAAQGTGFTFIGSVSKGGKGNVNSGAVPPWLLGNSDSLPGPSTSSSTVIGPTVEDLDKHKKQELKRKLPPERVGANKLHDMSHGGGSQMWLPSFGGVWNRGRRENTKQQFLRRYANRKGPP